MAEIEKWQPFAANPKLLDGLAPGRDARQLTLAHGAA
jgi:hypothetical protein